MRISDWSSDVCSSDLALLGTRRLQPQLRLLVCLALVAGMLPFLRFDYRPGPLPVTLLDPSFAIIWLLGGACAIGAAWQAKYHRLAALILTRGAGLATCISSVWLSAPDLGVPPLLEIGRASWRERVCQ